MRIRGRGLHWPRASSHAHLDRQVFTLNWGNGPNRDAEGIILPYYTDLAVSSLRIVSGRLPPLFTDIQALVPVVVVDIKMCAVYTAAP